MRDRLLYAGIAHALQTRPPGLCSEELGCYPLFLILNTAMMAFCDIGIVLVIACNHDPMVAQSSFTFEQPDSLAVISTNAA
jgi:hypothetical protein